MESTPPPSLSRATTSSLPALKAYLAGEREYRTAQWSDAVRHYHRAIEADSNFASAWFRLSSACGWGACSQEAREDYFRRALDLADQLPDRDAKRIRATSTNDIEALEGLTATYPDDVEAWVALAENYFHHIGVNLRPTEAYRGAFTRAVRLHPYYAEAYEHLIEDAFLRLDSLDAQRLIDGYVALGGNQACSYQVSYDLVWGTAAARERAMAVLDTVALIGVRAGTAGRAAARPRSHGADLCRRGGHGHPGARSNVCALAPAPGPRPERPDHGGPTRAGPAGRRTRDRQELPRDGRSSCTSRGSPTRPLLGVPRECSPPRERRRTTSGSGRSPSAKVAGPMSRRCGELSSDRPRASRRTVRPPGANARAYAAALGAYAGLVRGDRSRLAEFESALASGFPCSAIGHRTAAAVSPLPGRQAAVR